MNPTASTDIYISFDKSDLPYDVSGYRLGGTIVRNTNTDFSNMGFVSMNHAVSGEIRFRIEATSNTADLTYTFIFQYHTADTDENTTNTTPIIYIANNILSSSIGLPGATSDGKGLVSLDQVGYGQQNLIPNSMKELNQRGTSDTIASSTAEYLVSDRFLAQRNTTGFVTIDKDADLPSVALVGQSDKYECTSDGGSGNGLYVQTRIEAKDIKPYIGQKMTLSLYVKGTASLNMKMKIFSAASEDVWTSDLRTAPDTERHNLDFSTDGNWQRITYTFDVTTDFENGIALGYQSETANSITVGDIVHDWGWQLELGENATTVKRAGSTYAGELALCKRYYQCTELVEMRTGNGIGGNLSAIWYFATEMRDIPTMSWTNNGGDQSSNTPTTGKWSFVGVEGGSVPNRRNSATNVSADSEL